MSFDWAEYLRLAQELAGKSTAPASSNEAKLRSSISRAYYAAFGWACAVLQRVDHLTIPRRDKHEFVIRQFRGSANRARMAMGENLNRLRDNRNDADYKGTVTNLPWLAHETLLLAEHVVATLRQWHSSP